MLPTSGAEAEPRVFLLDGASGAGKTSLALAIASRRSDTTFVQRFTTRPRRSESDDEEYVFVNRETFDSLAEDGQFIEFRHLSLACHMAFRELQYAPH